MVGIYKITNPKGEAYIGYSKNIEKRFIQHKNLQFHGNNKLRESLTQYGGGSHLFEVVEEIDISNLNYRDSNSILRKRERYWINNFQSFKNGLNENKGGSGCSSHTEESKAKISKALKNKPKPKDFGAKRKKWQHTKEFKTQLRNAARKPIIVTDLEDNFIKEFNTQVQAAEWIGVSKPVIQLILRKKPQQNGKIPISTKGYKISYK